MYQIKTVASLTGLNSETLRAWERRYGVVSPTRDDGGRRVYSEDDVRRLKLLSNATLQGHSIGKIALLDNDDLQLLLNESLALKAHNHEGLIDQILHALKKYDIEQCEVLLRRGVVGMEPLVYVRDLLMPLLVETGDLWHMGEITVAQEHLLSNCIKRIVLNLLHNQMSYGQNNTKILFATLTGEQHEFGILMSSMLAVSKGYSAYYLGAEMPAKELLEARKHLNADVVVLSFVNNPLEFQTRADFDYLEENFPRNLTLIVGGVGATFLDLQRNSNHRTVRVKDFEELLMHLE